MQKSICIFCMLFILIVCNCRRHVIYYSLSSEAFKKEYPAEMLQQDFDFLWQSLNDIHPNLFLFTSKENMEKEYETIRPNLLNPMTLNEFYFTIHPMISNIKDNHTQFVYTPPDLTNILYAPFDLIFKKDHIYILHDDTKTNMQDPDYELIAINEEPVHDVIDRMNEFSIYETESQWKRTLESDFFKFSYHYLYPDINSFDLQFKNSNGEKIKKSANGLPFFYIANSRRENSKQPPLPYQLSFIEKDTKAVLSIKTFQWDKNFKSFIKNSFEQINQRHINKLIIDIRDNLGCKSNNANELLSYFIDKPFQSIPEIHIKVSKQFKNM